jgi:sugar phosphate isomerase/epimerase
VFISGLKIPMKLSQVAVQLYTLRDFCTTAPGFAASMKKVRAIGYPAVQISGVGPIPEAEIVAICKAEGLVICATHENGPTILDETDKVIARLRALGTTLTAYPWPEGIDFDNRGHLDTLIKKLDIAGARMRAAGMKLGYHNHAQEFYRPGGGKTFLERVYDETSPENVVAELDTFWVQRGGGDVVEWVKRVKGRMPVIHLKDFKVSANGDIGFCEIGAGTLPFKRIIAEAEAGGCEWFIVSIKQSFDYIKANLVS